MIDRAHFDKIKSWSEGGSPVPGHLVADLVRHCEELADTVVKQAVKNEKLKELLEVKSQDWLDNTNDLCKQINDLKSQIRKLKLAETVSSKEDTSMVTTVRSRPVRRRSH